MIRLQRVGKKHDPSFRVVVTEHTSGPRAGAHVEIVGSYDARRGKGSVQLNADRINHWLANGAKASDTVHNLLVSKGIVKAEKRDVLPRKKIADMEARRDGERKKIEEEAKAVKEAAELAAKEAEVPAEDVVTEATPTEEVPVA
ncbi:MAG: 30S ribosomal protein S16 [bacterium]|nr:30S ribosomal protein S16 [bacterium]